MIAVIPRFPRPSRRQRYARLIIPRQASDRAMMVVAIVGHERLRLGIRRRSPCPSPTSVLSVSARYLTPHDSPLRSPSPRFRQAELPARTQNGGLHRETAVCEE